ncbi:MAG TPA: ATP-binding protein, partial [Chitinophagaceae bacterium]|nr:ATP-binding protein [Chitinophagaceae bacterium]
HEKKNEIDSSIYFAKKGFTIAQNASFKKWLYETCLILSRVNEKKDPGQALHYHKLAITARDSMFNLQRITQSLNSRFNEQFDQLQSHSARLSYQNRVRMYVSSIVIGFLILLAIILWRNNRQKQKSKAKIERAYADLKATQQQLIQSEKMASLGELTAGIAHEIQNPLNFVNNFSEVNDELLKELKTEAEKGNLEEVKAIANDIAFNSEKINHHGKRADGIVKGMLQHSRTNSGQKEPTDINALADEYLRLAYHGLRAKDKSFNVQTKTDFDSSIGKINIVPQDIGRVILNLINNAFYAVHEKRKPAGDLYEPTVSVSTKKTEDKIEIKVKDNGNGIPQKVLDKIFQPFFTTKPTGQGTGLGLSLSYDIVKAHGGELNVETKEGEGSAFIIHLPAA